MWKCSTDCQIVCVVITDAKSPEMNKSQKEAGSGPYLKKMMDHNWLNHIVTQIQSVFFLYLSLKVCLIDGEAGILSNYLHWNAVFCQFYVNDSIFLPTNFCPRWRVKFPSEQRKIIPATLALQHNVSPQLKDSDSQLMLSWHILSNSEDESLFK